MQVLLLCGGASSEREVSLRSGSAVQAALEQLGHTVTMHDPAEDTPDALLQSAAIVFPVLHGKGGEDGELQARLEALNVPFVGSGAAASALCFNKEKWRVFVAEHGFTVAAGEVVTYDQFWESPLITNGFVLKPYDGGSSIDTIIHRNGTINKTAVSEAFSRNPSMLLEALIEGIEITVAVVGTAALPVIEIIPPSDGEFDYDNKYNGCTEELCPPRNINAAQQAEAQNIALGIHTATGCSGMSRTDIIVSGNTLYALETNTIPGMTNQSLLPKAAAAAGMDMPQLVQTLLDQALTTSAN